MARDTFRRFNWSIDISGAANTDVAVVKVELDAPHADTLGKVSRRLTAPQTASGSAKRHPGDKADVSIGALIATVRALEMISQNIREEIRELTGYDFP